ncbi:MAG: hypothetical protein AAGB05_15475 [Pseudomonadota bacterium]
MRLSYVGAALSLIVCSLWALHIVHGTSPALNSELRVEGPVGQTRQGPSPAMFDPGAYFMQSGYDFLYADALSDEVLTAAAAAAFRSRATELFEAALQHDPANAHVWQGYAQSLLFVPEALVPMRRALEISAELAPNTPLLAAARLHAIKALRIWTGMPDAEATRAASDLSVLRLHAPHVTDGLERR